MLKVYLILSTDHGAEEDNHHLRMIQRPKLLHIEIPQVPGARFCEVDAFLHTRSNAHSERPTFRTYACNDRMIVVGNILHPSLVSNVAAVSHAWMSAVVQEISGCETAMLHHLINASNVRRIRFRVIQDDWEMYEGPFSHQSALVHRGRMIPRTVYAPPSRQQEVCAQSIMKECPVESPAHQHLRRQSVCKWQTPKERGIQVAIPIT